MSIYKCHYGCGQQAKHQNKSGNWMCDTSANKCPENKKKNSKGLKESYSSGKKRDPKEIYRNLPEETKRKMNWNKGLTKHDHPSIVKYSDTLSKKMTGQPGKKHTKESKEKMSLRRIEFLENNSKWCNWYEVGGIKVQGLLEKNFAEFLLSKNLSFKRERLIYQDYRRYTPDFYIPELNLYIEVKGFLFEKDKAKLSAVLLEHNIDLRLAYKTDIDNMETIYDVKSLPRAKDIIDNEGIDYSVFNNHWGN